MNNEKIHKLREKLMEELEKCYREAPLDTATMESIYKISKSIKAIDTICAMEENSGYSNMRGNSNNRGRSYSNGYWPMSYDEAKFNMAHKLNDLMMCTENEHTKNVLRNAINQLEVG